MVKGSTGRQAGRPLPAQIRETVGPAGTIVRPSEVDTSEAQGKVAAFIEGGANFLSALRVPLTFSKAIISVLVACFAATTLDTATRLQRYVIQELAGDLGLRPLTNKYSATLVAVGAGLAVAMLPRPQRGTRDRGPYPRPLLGATNQLLAGMALLVTSFYLWRRGLPIWFIVGPLVLMSVMPAWAMLWNLFNQQTGWWWKPDGMILGRIPADDPGLSQAWMLWEGGWAWSRAKGVLEERCPRCHHGVSSPKASPQPRPKPRRNAALGRAMGRASFHGTRIAASRDFHNGTRCAFSPRLPMMIVDL